MAYMLLLSNQGGVTIWLAGLKQRLHTIGKNYKTNAKDDSKDNVEWETNLIEASLANSSKFETEQNIATDELLLDCI